MSDDKAAANPTDAERELLRELDVHDGLVLRCARGELSWEEFDRAYDSFYARYPLDGHESDAAELQLFEKHADRIALHRDVWDQLITAVIQDEQSTRHLTPVEAVRRLAELVRRHLQA